MGKGSTESDLEGSCSLHRQFGGWELFCSRCQLPNVMNGQLPRGVVSAAGLINKGSGTNLSTSRLVTHQENHTQMAFRSPNGHGLDKKPDTGISRCLCLHHAHRASGNSGNSASENVSSRLQTTRRSLSQRVTKMRPPLAIPSSVMTGSARPKANASCSRTKDSCMHWPERGCNALIVLTNGRQSRWR